jgi:hypothetical protein
MLHTRDGWQEIVSDDGKWKSYMVIFMAGEANEWDGITGLLPAITALIKRRSLTDASSISIGSGHLTVIFHAAEDQDLPDSFREAGKELLALIAPSDGDPAEPSPNPNEP